MASFFRFASRNAGISTRLACVMTGAAITSFAVSRYQRSSNCEALAEDKKSNHATEPMNHPSSELLLKLSEEKVASTSSSVSSANANATANTPIKAGFQPEAKGYFYDIIPNSQLFQPKLAWPMWDDDWDGREPVPTGNDKLDRRKRRYLRKHGVTRHIILVRHGQYDETHHEDEKRILTEMGRKQANETGKRILKMIQGIEGDTSSPCNVKVVHVSGLARAKETADIIASHFPLVERSEPDPLLNEGRPAHTIPSGGRVGQSTMHKTQEQHTRIEQAFHNYFYRADEIEMPHDRLFLEDEGKHVPPPKIDSLAARHEYEIIICHANVIRYFFCRALQLPPEAWLRICTFNCSLTYMTIRPTGGVSCRMLGDIGHLPPELVSFSGHHGFNW